MTLRDSILSAIAAGASSVLKARNIRDDAGDLARAIAEASMPGTDDEIEALLSDAESIEAVCNHLGAPTVREVNAGTLTFVDVDRVRTMAGDDAELHAACVTATNLNLTRDQSAAARARCAAAYNALPEAARRLDLVDRVRWLAGQPRQARDEFRETRAQVAEMQERP